MRVLHKKLMFTLSAMAAMALLGCSSGDKLPCSTTDWYELGRRHGAQGRPDSEIERIRFGCSNEEERKDALALFESGRGLGLAEYCTEENGLEVGRHGQRYFEVCPDVLEEAFLTGFHKGVKLAAQDQKARRISADINEIEKKLQAPGLSLGRRGLLEGQKLQLLEEQKSLESEIDIARAATSEELNKPEKRRQ